MSPRDYTPDEICRCLGLDGFRADYWTRDLPADELKVLLCPSFHPEVCLIFTEGDGEKPVAVVSSAEQERAPPATNVQVLCAQTHIWTLDKAAPVEVAADKGIVGHLSLAQLEARFREALTQPDRRGSVKIDGMGVHIVWRHYFATLLVEKANPDPDDQLGAFLRNAIQSAFDAVGSAVCRDGLARAAGNVGLRLPLSSM